MNVDLRPRDDVRAAIAKHWHVDTRLDVHVTTEQAHGGWIARVEVCTFDGRTDRFSEVGLEREAALAKLVEASALRAENARELSEWRARNLPGTAAVW